MSQWFRFYADTLHNRKAQTLSPFLFKVWVNCLCLGCRHGGALPSLKDVSYSLRLSEDKTFESLRALADAKFLCPGSGEQSEDGYWTIHDWGEWQYESDTSTDRVRKHRQRKQTGNRLSGDPGNDNRNATTKQGETFQERSGNVIDQIRSDTDTEQKQKQTRETFPPDLSDYAKRIHDRHPKGHKGSLQATERAFAALVGSAVNPEREAAAVEANHEAWCKSTRWKSGYVLALDRWLTPDRAYAEPPDPVVDPMDAAFEAAFAKLKAKEMPNGPRRDKTPVNTPAWLAQDTAGNGE